MKATVKVRLKTEVLDPAGDAVKRALKAQGFDDVENVRIGKLIEIDSGSDLDEAKLKQMCEKLLSNPVIEDFEIQLG